MAYDYIEKMYGTKFTPKMRVQHTVTGNFGEVRRPGNTPGNYVSVRFDGFAHNMPCHPSELKIEPHGQELSNE